MDLLGLRVERRKLGMGYADKRDCDEYQTITKTSQEADIAFTRGPRYFMLDASTGANDKYLHERRINMLYQKVKTRRFISTEPVIEDLLDTAGICIVKTRDSNWECII